MAGLDHLGVAFGLATWILLRFYRARRRMGKVVGPPVLVGEAPLPLDDLRSGSFATVSVAANSTTPAPPVADPDEEAPLTVDDSPIDPDSPEIAVPVMPPARPAPEAPAPVLPEDGEVISWLLGDPGASAIGAGNLRKNQVDPIREA